MRQVVGDVPLAGSPFPPIADYAFLSDCEVCALVAPSGNVEWMCLPRFDGPSIFGGALDRDAGAFTLAPVDTSVPAGRRYLPGTMVMETTWGTRTGWIIVRDVLLIGPWHHEHDRSHTHRRSPTDTDADHVLLRTMRCVNGRVEMRMECEPKLDYGRTGVRWQYTGEGYGAASVAAEEHDIELHLTTDMRLGFEGGRARARSTLRDGDTAFIALSWSEHPAPQTYDEAYHRLVYTADFWHEWLSVGDFPDHPWRTYLQRSALTLKGLSYAPTGAMVAAATTSLPETPGGLRNWDYRFSWIRDSTFMLWGLYTLGFDEEANDFFYFIRDVVSAETDELQIMYGIGGETELEEQTLDHLSGYENARPVRIGNGAFQQRQHDVWGALLDSIWLHTKSRDGLAESTWAILVKQVEDAIRHWREPDRGIWEVRGEPRHFTSSKLMCWVACDRGARLARLREDSAKASRWQATVNAIDEELTEHGLVLRYRVSETDDGLVGEEGSFAICSFWLVSALAEIGESARARSMCERLLAYASPLGLFAEEIDPHSGRHLGNFPQAFTHLALINAVMHVIRADQGLEAGPFELGRELARQRS